MGRADAPTSGRTRAAARAFEERTAAVVWARQYPELAPLRADPRYAALDRLLRY